MSYDPPNTFYQIGSGDMRVSNLTPLVQINGEGGIQPDKVSVVETGLGATVDTIKSKFRLRSGTDANSVASAVGKRFARCRAGQSLLCRVSAIIPAGADQSLQMAGMITSENGVGFGRLNGDFGIIHYYGGIPENLVLTITVSGAGGATVTVDDLPYLVTLTAGTTEHNAFEIANQLAPQIPSYNITSNGSTVVFQGVIPKQGGSFDYTGAGTATFDLITIGQGTTLDFVPQSAWNEDTADWLDPSLGNVYDIDYQYTGFGGIRLYIQDPETCLPLLVHTIKWANSNTELNSTDPSFRVGWLAQNTGATVPVEIQGGSASAFLQGKIKTDSLTRGLSNAATIPTSMTSVLSIRNAYSINGRINRIELLPILSVFSAQLNQFAIFTIYINPTYNGELIWQYVDEDSSPIEFSTDQVTITGGVVLQSFALTSGQTLPLQFNQSDGRDLAISRGDVIIIAARASNATGEMQTSITIEQDD